MHFIGYAKSGQNWYGTVIRKDYNMSSLHAGATLVVFRDSGNEPFRAKL